MKNKPNSLVAILNNYYTTGVYDEEKLKLFVNSGMITQDEYNSIVPTSGDITLDELIDEEIEEVSL